MKKLFLSTGLALSAFLIFGLNYSAHAVVDSSDVKAVIITPMVIDCGASLLDFGKIAAGSTAGTIAVSTTGSALSSGGASSLGGTAKGHCDLQGDSGYRANIIIQNYTAVSDGAGPGTDMTMSNFRMAYNGSAEQAAPMNGVTLSSSAAPLLVGATLNVGAGQAAGTYTGSFTIQVLYQ